VCWEGDEGVWSVGRPDADGAVPARGAEGVFCDKVPRHAKDFAIVLLPVLDGKVVECAIEELDAAVAGGGENLVLVDLGPGEVVEGVLGCEPKIVSLVPGDLYQKRLPLGRDDAVWRQFEDIQAAIANEAKVGR
jgi:hypothetical protein